MPMRWVTPVAGVVATAAALLGPGAATAAPASPVVTPPVSPAWAPQALPRAEQPRHHPSRLANVGASRQVIVVTAPSWSSTRGTLRAYERRADGTWDTVLAATPAWLGYGGLARASSRRQGTGTTPAGTFAIPTSFGRSADPGGPMPYVRFDRDDVWPYDPGDPKTYNVFQHEPAWKRWSRGYVEHLWGMGRQYSYVAVLDYNLPRGPVQIRPNGVRTALNPADTRRGGGIFLHVEDDGPTAGCIAIPIGPMQGLLRWLDPAANPVLVAGPYASIDRM